MTAKVPSRRTPPVILKNTRIIRSKVNKIDPNKMENRLEPKEVSFLTIQSLALCSVIGSMFLYLRKCYG